MKNNKVMIFDDVSQGSNISEKQKKKLAEVFKKTISSKGSYKGPSIIIKSRINQDINN